METTTLSEIPFETVSQYSIEEEIAHAVIHGIGVLFSVVGLTTLLLLAGLFGTNAHLMSYLIYGLSLVALYVASTLYHALPHFNAKRIFKICDHAAIYLLIAGTYTPFLVLSLPEIWGTALLIVIWTLALIGVAFKLFFTGRFHFVSTATYVLMGWIGVVALRPMMENLPPNGFFWLMAGGLLYTLGTVFYMAKKMRFHHAIWHTFVLAGSVSHFVSIIYSSNLLGMV